MKYIDFHVHAFADKIAERTIASLSAICGTEPATNGTLSDTLSVQKEWGTDAIVLLSIATKPSQHLVCNNWAASCKAENVFPFGSVHPDGEDALSELERIKELGLYGVKLHPDYQGFFVDEPRMSPIYEKCGELGLPIVFHAGFDPVCPETVHCPPSAAANVIAAHPNTTFILAHMGGNEMWEEVEEHLAGKFRNLYLDTSLAGSFIPEDTLLRLIRKHGADRILFASDCPWDSALLTRQKIERLPLTPSEKNAIFSQNALSLLRRHAGAGVPPEASWCCPGSISTN